MALQKDFTYHGMTVQGGYLKISSVSGNKSMVFLQLDYFVAAGLDPVKTASFSFSPDMGGENFIKQGYLHLKGLDEFSGAEDV